MAGTLERLRPQVKEHMLQNDERDLFNLANNFAIRHFNDKQKTDWESPTWLSWMFYVNLATVHLITRLLRRQANREGSFMSSVGAGPTERLRGRDRVRDERRRYQAANWAQAPIPPILGGDSKLSRHFHAACSVRAAHSLVERPIGQGAPREFRRSPISRWQTTTGDSCEEGSGKTTPIH
jgi:hypothetical protein